MSEVEVNEMSEEEWDQLRKDLITRLKTEYPDWKERVRDCHVKCWDIDLSFAMHLWMVLTDDDVEALYEEAGR